MPEPEIVWTTCEETIGMIGDDYLRCGRSSTMLVQHRGRREGPYQMCEECGSHNVRNRGAEMLVRREEK